MSIQKSQAILKCFISSLVFGLRWAQRTKPCFVTQNFFSIGLPVKVFKTLNGRQTEGIFDMARGNVPATCVAFKRLLRCSDDRSLPLVEKICDSMGFRAAPAFE